MFLIYNLWKELKREPIRFQTKKDREDLAFSMYILTEKYGGLIIHSYSYVYIHRYMLFIADKKWFFKYSKIRKKNSGKI